MLQPELHTDIRVTAHGKCRKFILSQWGMVKGKLHVAMERYDGATLLWKVRGLQEV